MLKVTRVSVYAAVSALCGALSPFLVVKNVFIPLAGLFLCGVFEQLIERQGVRRRNAVIPALIGPLLFVVLGLIHESASLKTLIVPALMSFYILVGATVMWLWYNR